MGKSKLWTVFGAQWGSEGKGEICALITKNERVDLAVRIGGPNAGHSSILEDGTKVVVRSIPTPVMFGVDGVIGPEGMIHPDVLEAELRRAYQILGRPAKLYVDGCTSVVGEKHIESERNSGLTARIGSTSEGVGACTVDKVMRIPSAVVKDFDVMQGLIERFNGPEFNVVWGANTVQLCNDALLGGQNLLIEGTQGYGLSLNTGGYYPFCTSRECTPQALWAGTGINPKNASVSEVVAVCRTYPIRVGGNSGPMEGEMTWEQLKEVSHGYVKVPEKTTVTQRERRIAWWNNELFHRAILQTCPDVLAITFLDYRFPELAGLGAEELEANQAAKRWLDGIAFLGRLPVKYASTGPGKSFYLYH